MPKDPPPARRHRSAGTKDPKASHLYTDDNPATTIHGTGFRDQAAAHKTLELIKKRSLTYQFQTVNTMYNRAKHHPSMKNKIEGSAGTSGMREAMEVFRDWLDGTYHAQRDALRAGGFKPLLSKGCVERYLSQIEQSETIEDVAKVFARKYATMAKGKRLGNVLVDDAEPAEADWEIKRYQALDDLVPPSHDTTETKWDQSELWTDDGRLTPHHLALVAWAWSPVKESKLP